MMQNNPPSPAIAEPIIVAVYLYAVTFIPAASAVPGFSPTALKFNPILVFFKTTRTTIAINIAKYTKTP